MQLRIYHQNPIICHISKSKNIHSSRNVGLNVKLSLLSHFMFYSNSVWNVNVLSYSSCSAEVLPDKTRKVLKSCADFWNSWRKAGWENSLWDSSFTGQGHISQTHHHVHHIRHRLCHVDNITKAPLSFFYCVSTVDWRFLPDPVVSALVSLVAKVGITLWSSRREPLCDFRVACNKTLYHLTVALREHGGQ